MSAEMPPINIRPEHWEIVRRILRAHVPAREVWAFGSRVHGKAKRFSDLDLAVIGEEPLSISLMADLNEAFSESDLPFKVDVVDWATTRDSFRRVIECDCVIIQPARVATAPSG